jgi:Kelch motif
VLVVGGTAQCGTSVCPTTAAEVYDPATGTWTSTSNSLYQATYPSVYFQATVLPDGTALALGAVDSIYYSTPVAEIYNISTSTWVSVAAPTVGPSTATLLTDGSVLAAGGTVGGGVSASPVNTVEIYEPSAASWAQTGSLNDARELNTATLLADGTVLIAGGAGCPSSSCEIGAEIVLSSAEIYDPSSGVWTLTGSMTSARSSQTATLLPDGTVLVVGGTSYFNGTNYVVSAEIYYP